MKFYLKSIREFLCENITFLLVKSSTHVCIVGNKREKHSVPLIAYKHNKRNSYN